MCVCVYVFSEILLSDKKEWKVDTYDNVGGSQNTYAEWQKPNTKEFTYGMHPNL